jgi:hypothetical protein
VAKAPLGVGLLARVAGREGTDPGVAWKLDGEAVLLRITEPGLQAIGAAPAPAAPEPQPGSVAEPPAQASAAAQEGAVAAAAPLADAAQATAASEASQGASAAISLPTRREALRGAAQAVLAAWDDAPGGEHAGVAAAIEQLRQALAKPEASRAASGPRSPRTGIKQAAVLALLRRPEGVTPRFWPERKTRALSASWRR